MPTFAAIRAHVESRLPGALTPQIRSECEMVPTGIQAVDAQTGGIPKGALTQLCAPGKSSSGKTTLLLSTMAQLTNQGEFCATVDADDCLDPASAAAAGVELSHMLWVRCREKRGMRSLEQAFKAADILVQNGGFGLIAVDLGNIDESLIKKVPLTTWFRFSRVVEKMPTALVVVTPVSAAQSCAALTLNVAGSEVRWEGTCEVSHAQLVNAVEFKVEVMRARTRKAVQSARPEFTASAQWA